MKVRASFVSNSSSSSFIIQGKKVKFKDVEVGNYCVEPNGGWSGEVEDFIFKVTKYRKEEMEKAFSKQTLGNLHFIRPIQIIKEDREENLVVEKKEKGEVFVLNNDYMSPYSDSDDDENFRKWLGDIGFEGIREESSLPCNSLVLYHRCSYEEAKERLRERKPVWVYVATGWEVYLTKAGTAFIEAFHKRFPKLDGSVTFVDEIIPLQSKKVVFLPKGRYAWRYDSTPVKKFANIKQFHRLCCHSQEELNQLLAERDRQYEEWCKQYEQKHPQKEEK